LQAIITDNFQAISGEWQEAFFATYGAPDFLRRKTNQFANPVGSTISSCIEEILQLLQNGAKQDALRSPLDGIFHIRAVQEFTPSQALAPLLAIKSLLKKHAPDKGVSLSVADWSTIDSMVLLAFDIYMECREQLYRAQVQEITSGNRMILKNAVCPSKFLQNQEAVGKDEKVLAS
jgi:hypothetical protein